MENARICKGHLSLEFKGHTCEVYSVYDHNNHFVCWAGRDPLTAMFVVGENVEKVTEEFKKTINSWEVTTGEKSFDDLCKENSKSDGDKEVTRALSPFETLMFLTFFLLSKNNCNAAKAETATDPIHVLINNWYEDAPISLETYTSGTLKRNDGKSESFLTVTFKIFNNLSPVIFQQIIDALSYLCHRMNNRPRTEKGLAI